MAVKVREKHKGSGIWYIFIDHRGKRKAKKIGKDKKLALEAAKKIEAKLALGDMGLVEKTETESTFKEYAITWLSITVPATCKNSTIKDYITIMNNHILPYFGKYKTTEINRMMVKKFLMEKIQAGFAASTVAHMKTCIAGAMSIAVDDEVIDSNPAHGLGKIFRKKNVNADVNPLTREELSQLLDGFSQHYPMYYPLALTLARTGMRLGEVLALQWDDIDYEKRLITVSRTFARGKINAPKNGKNRAVDMSQQLVQVLKNLQDSRNNNGHKGQSKNPEWVFLNKIGRPVDINHWRKRIFYKVLEKTNLRKVRVHDLRHTYASMLIEAGESLAYVRDQLGHHSIKVTVDIYVHLMPGGNKQAVDKLDEVA